MLLENLAYRQALMAKALVAHDLLYFLISELKNERTYYFYFNHNSL